MPRKKKIKPVTALQLFTNQIVPDNSNKETFYDGEDSKWQDLSMELLLHILMFVDHHTVIIASGVCKGWKEAIDSGVQELSLSWCRWKNMNKLVMSVVPKFTRLQSLDLSHFRNILNDQAVEMVAKYCHDLRALDLSDSTQLTGKALEALAHGCNLLEILYISGCFGVTHSALTFLSEKCSKLMHLSLWGCLRAVTDRALLALAHNCCGLQFLNLSWCKKVTDFGVTGLAKWCPELRAVCLSGCALITDQSVIALAENCCHLRSLELLFCRSITDTAMYSLVNSIVHRPVKPNVKDKGNNSRYNSEPESKYKFCRCCIKHMEPASHDYSGPVLNDHEDYGLVLLNIEGCKSLSAPAVQAVCDAFPALHTCPGRQSLIISGDSNLTSVHCVCAIEAPENRETEQHFYPQQF